jgi:glycosyltransferase involved in cell wall biosynthesis
LAGTGDDAAIRARAVELGVENSVEFLGWIEGEAKLRALREAGIYALPSWIEGLPMGLLEAMAVGLPVVATRVGGIPDVVVEGSGKLVPPKDTDALTAALLELIASAPLRARMGAAARRVALERFAPERILPRIETVYFALGAVPRGVTAGTSKR